MSLRQRFSGRNAPGPAGLLAALAFVLCCAGPPEETASHPAPADSGVPILNEWSGDFPVAELDRLPADQRDSRVGWIGDGETFESIWAVFRPDEATPEVNFAASFIVFVRNVDFYNRTSILKATLTDGELEVLARETMSALPIEDRAAMSLAVIPRAGVQFIRVGDQRLPVSAD